MYWGDHFWGMHLFWWIFWLALVAVLMFWAWPRAAQRRDSALDVLRRRYAAGEISDEEYHHRLAILAGSRDAQGPATSSERDARGSHSSPAA